MSLTWRLSRHFDQDINSEVKKIAKFLEAELDSATIADIAERCTFEGMKATLDNSRYADRRVMARKGLLRHPK